MCHFSHKSMVSITQSRILFAAKHVKVNNYTRADHKYYLLGSYIVCRLSDNEKEGNNALNDIIRISCSVTEVSLKIKSLKNINESLKGVCELNKNTTA